jgi:hypothetical protein
VAHFISPCRSQYFSDFPSFVGRPLAAVGHSPTHCELRVITESIGRGASRSALISGGSRTAPTPPASSPSQLFRLEKVSDPCPTNSLPFRVLLHLLQRKNASHHSQIGPLGIVSDGEIHPPIGSGLKCLDEASQCPVYRSGDSHTLCFLS